MKKQTASIRVYIGGGPKGARHALTVGNGVKETGDDGRTDRDIDENKQNM